MEGAFTIPVPQGWRVDGGLKRFTAIDTRPELTAVSPDNQIIIQMGDSFIPSFSLPTQMGPRKGYAFAQTLFVPFPGGLEGGTLFVHMFNGYLADPKVKPLARVLLNHMVAGFEWDPNWSIQQTRTAGQVSGIISQTHNEIMNIINQTFENKAKAEDLMFENWSRAQRGEVLIQDPETNERFEVPLGSNYYFRVGSDNAFIGTDAANSPNLPGYWLREMKIIQ